MSNPAVRPPPKPGQVKVFKAMYDYKAQRPDEISFSEGDLIYVIDMVTDTNWYKAKINDSVGLVPSNYIEESAESVLNPMHEAAKRGNSDFLKECLGNNVSCNSLDKAGNTPLHWAAYGGHAECVQLLLQSPNVLLNLQNKLGDTPLHNAAYKNHADICQLLVDQGARLDIVNRDQKAPFDCAIDSKCRSLLDYKVDKEALLERNREYLDDEEEQNDSD